MVKLCPPNVKNYEDSKRKQKLILTSPLLVQMSNKYVHRVVGAKMVGMRMEEISVRTLCLSHRG
jgi:hypothetical protein